jgi:hypothetical protein
MAKRQSVPLSYWAAQDKMYLTPEEAADVIGCDPHKIRVQSTTQAGRDAMGFPVIRLGNVTKIPRIPFLRKLGWEGEIVGASA